jgi:hypothetical protein
LKTFFIGKSEVEKMEEEITRLKAELEEQRSRCRGLENDLDDMALDNDRLYKLLALAGGGAGGNSATTFKSRAPPASNSNEEKASDGSSPSASGTSSDTAFECRDLLVDGDDSCTDLAPLKIKDGCGGKNVICVAFCAYPGAVNDSCNQNQNWSCMLAPVSNSQTYCVFCPPA